MGNKETLKEAAEIFVKNRFTKQICNDESYPDIYASKEAIVESHILFAKWQQERMYSEEEVIRFADWILHKRFEMRNDNHQNWWGKFNEEKDYTSKELLEQFKKK